MKLSRFDMLIIIKAVIVSSKIKVVCRVLRIVSLQVYIGALGTVSV